MGGRNLGLFPYLGKVTQGSPNLYVRNTKPNSNIIHNVFVGDFWLYLPNDITQAELFVLMSLSGGVANWVNIATGTGDLLYLTGNTGGAISPVNGNINLLTANTTLAIAGSAGQLITDYNISTLILGSLPAIAGAVRNVGLGSAALAGLTTGTDNTAIGFGALTTSTGAHNRNTAVGSLALTALNDGDSNTAVGDDALTANVHGSFNTAVGANALGVYTGNNAVAIGYNALSVNSTGTFNTAVGTSAGALISTGDSNTALGYEALSDVITGSNNTACGSLALNTTTGSDNTAFGFSALGQVLDGSGNIAIGYEAGINYIGSESANILIGNSGTAAEDFTIKIGTQGTQTSCYIAGISNSIVANPIAVVIDPSTGQLGTGSGTAGTIDVINTTANATSPAAVNLIKNRTNGPIVAGDQIGCVNFQGYDTNNSSQEAASIRSISTGTIGAARVPGNLYFYTTPDTVAPSATQRMQILSDGTVHILSPDSAASVALTVTGQISCGGDAGSGVASNVDLTNTTNLAANGAGIFTVASKSTNPATSSGFLKIYVNNVAYWIPLFANPAP